MTHRIEGMECKAVCEGGAAVTLMRGVCACGWKAVWLRDQYLAKQVAAQHLDKHKED